MTQQFTQGHALLVGVGADLPNTVDDATGLAALLADTERCAYPTGHVHLFTEQQATRSQILNALDQLAASSDANATIIFYFLPVTVTVKSIQQSANPTFFYPMDMR